MLRRLFFTAGDEIWSMPARQGGSSFDFTGERIERGGRLRRPYIPPLIGGRKLMKTFLRTKGIYIILIKTPQIMKINLLLSRLFLGIK